MSRAEYSLLKNGLDFVVRAAASMSKIDILEDDAKYAVINLWSGILLILKERIHREHWTLLFANNSKVDRSKFDSGDFTSISIDQIIQILDGVCGINLTHEMKFVLEPIRKKRNVIEHFQFSESIDSLKSITAKALNFCFTFIDNHLEPMNFGETEGKLFQDLKDFSNTFDVFVNERMLMVDEYFNSHETLVLICPYCERKALSENIENSEEYKCLFCVSKSSDFEKIANVYVENQLGISSYFAFKDGDEFPVFSCVDCGVKSFIPLDEDYSNYHCIACRANYSKEEIDNCSRCSNLIKNDNETIVCSECYVGLYERD